MFTSLIIWYIVVEHRAGVVVFLWLFIFIEYYFFLKYRQFLPAIMIVIVTQVLIIGYELQVLTLGEAVSERTGQPYYPYVTTSFPHRVGCLLFLEYISWGHIGSPVLQAGVWLPSSGLSSQSP